MTRIYYKNADDKYIRDDGDAYMTGEPEDCCCVGCVEGEEPIAGFSWTQENYFPFRINLFDESTVHENCTDGMIVSWAWYKNDEEAPFSTSQNPTAVAMSAGDTIRLVVTDSCGCTDEVVGDFLTPCADLTAFLAAHSLSVKLEGGTFNNDPGCCVDEWGDPGFTTPEHFTSTIACDDVIRSPAACTPGTGLPRSDNYIRCSGDLMLIDAQLCWDSTPGWEVVRNNYAFPPFIATGAWYDMGVVTPTGSSGATCYPTGMRMYAKWT